MPETPIALTVPRLCVKCHSSGTVRIHHYLKGRRMLLKWRCTDCEAERAVVSSDQAKNWARRHSTRTTKPH